MSKQDNLTDFLTDVADAIREKKGTEDLINPQDFSDEIKNLPSGSSPFAVDFGEEIATGNPAFIGALQEDIDYYNEVQRRRAAGEVTDKVLAQEQEFRDKIVWWPKGMSGDVYTKNYAKIPYKKLKRFVFPETERDYYDFQCSPNLEEVEFTAKSTRFTGCFLHDSNLKKVTIYGNIVTADDIFKNCLSLESVYIDASNITNANSMFQNNYSLKDVSLSFDSLNSVSECFLDVRCENLSVNMPNVTSLTNTFRACEVRDTLYLNIPKVKTVGYSLFYNNTGHYLLGENVYISGLMVSMSLNVEGAKNVSAESIKYILDHCQAREDGAAYTLTLHADVFARFMAKCTEGNEEYDAEYAASLASANSKGLTLA